MKWQVKFANAITLDFGESVDFSAGVWTEIKPRWMSHSTIKGVEQLVDNSVEFELMDTSGTIWPSTDPKIKRVVGEAYRQLMFFKVVV